MWQVVSICFFFCERWRYPQPIEDAIEQCTWIMNIISSPLQIFPVLWFAWTWCIRIHHNLRRCNFDLGNCILIGTVTSQMREKKEYCWWPYWMVCLFYLFFTPPVIVMLLHVHNVSCISEQDSSIAGAWE